jgi:hypothetical protein
MAETTAAGRSLPCMSRYPASLADAIPLAAEHRDRWIAARDVYGRPLHYTSDGKEFVLASYGKDGLPDRNLADPEVSLTNPICSDANADTTYTSNGRTQ